VAISAARSAGKRLANDRTNAIASFAASPVREAAGISLR